MPPKIKSIVVDTSVARAANDKMREFALNHPETALLPMQCAQFLEGMMFGHYCVVFSETLNDEWNRHRSTYSAKWRLSMTSRKLVCYVKHTEPILKTKVLATQSQDKEKDAMEKDFHLIEAAMASDRAIASLDDTVRSLYSQAANSVGEIKQIVWGNPGNPAEDLLHWLQNGAPADDKRQLGCRTNKKSL